MSFNIFYTKIRFSECIEAKVGTSEHKRKLLIATGYANYKCPDSIDKSNWIGSEKWDDKVAIHFKYSSFGVYFLIVERTDEQEGWGFDLRFECCDNEDCKCESIYTYIYIYIYI